jgi:hypothetical protein
MLIVRRLPHPPDQRCELAEDIPFLRGLIFVSNMDNGGIYRDTRKGRYYEYHKKPK